MRLSFGAAAILNVALGLAALVVLGSTAVASDHSKAESASGSLAAAGVDAARAAGDSAHAESGLGPTTTVPWNPPEPVGEGMGWERAVRAPLRLLTFPLKLVGMAGEGTAFYVERHSVVPRVQVLLAVLPRRGIFIGPAGFAERIGLGGTLLYRPPALKNTLALEMQASTREYSRFRADFERGPGAVNYINAWLPRERFFGIGLGTSEAQASSYSYRVEQLGLALSYPWQRLNQPPPRFQARAWAGPRTMIQHQGHEPPSFEQTFPPIAGQLDQRQEHFVYGIGLNGDRRSGTPHWSRGWRVNLEAARYDQSVEALALRDAHTTAATFTRYSFFGEGGFSFYRDPRTVRLAVKAVNLRIDEGSTLPLLPDLSRLGGNQGLAGFDPGRFQDQDLIVGKLTYIIPLTRNFEIDLHAESGGVFPQLDHARLTSFRNSYGVALRPRLDVAPLGWIGVDWSDEAVRFRFAFGGVE